MKHRHVSISDSETDYSESDVSMEIPRQRTYRRRSVSRQRVSPDYSTTYLGPGFEETYLHRSASTGARRRPDRERERDRQRDTTRRDRDRERERDRVQPTAVIVDIKNESRNKSVDRSANKNRKQRTQHQEDNTYLDPYDDSEDETLLRPHRRRHAASVSASRDASPFHPPARDLELVLDQRMLQKNDQRQDLELFRQQQEIERLERQLARHRDRDRDGQHEVRLLKEEEEYEVEISDRLRRLQRFEEKERMEEEQRKAERRYKLQKFEEAQRQEKEQEEVRTKLRQEKLRDLQRKMEEEEERERIKKEIRDEEARQLLARQEREAKEAAMKQAAVEEWKLAEERRRLAEREAKERRDREFRDRLKMEFGYNEEQIEAILKKKPVKEEKKDKEKEKEKDKDKKDDKDKDKGKDKAKDDDKDKDDRRATWIKVHRKHLLPDTLIAYRLPWDWDEIDGNYIIIKQWISEDFQEELFGHTRRLREGKLVTQTSSTLTELKVNDRKKDKMYLVRKKSPSRRSWIFT